MTIVYALELVNGKYYVGKTVNVERRYRDHVNGHRSSAWTMKYKPVKILETIPYAHNLDEDRLTVEYMMKYGIENVRGGPYVSVKLSQDTMDHITKRIRMAYDLCMKCGGKDHFGAHCKAAKNKKTIDEVIPEEVTPDENPVCGKCGSGIHYTEDCCEIIS